MDNEKKPITRHRIEIKVSESQKNVIAQAADISKVGVAEFVRRAAEQTAMQVISGRKNS